MTTPDKLPLREKFCYGFGDLASVLYWQTFMVYLSFFYTDVFGLAPFARRLRVPGHYLWGYNDEVCPPTSMFAAFNTITAPKELTLLLEVGHAYPVEQNEHTAAWIARFLNLK